MTDQNNTGRLPFYRRLKRWQMIALIVLLATLVRLWAAWQLPIDADEPVYLKAGQVYAQFIRSGNWAGILQTDVNFEHPPLVKLMYSLPYLFIEPRFGQTTEFFIDRLISVVWGGLAVGILAVIDPLAGFFLAADSMVIKYTSQVYLESFPLFAGLLSVYAFRRFSNLPHMRRWFWISAIGIGAAVAGKYLYGVFLVPILVLMWGSKNRSWKNFVFYGLAALLAFVALDPAIWLDPIGRLWQSLTFHMSYSTSSRDVAVANYPWYQPFTWISSMVPWHPQVFFFPTLDVPILIFCLIGIFWERKQRAWSIIWAGAALFVLLIWPTHWPQYTLILIPALCLVASTGLWHAWSWLVDFSDHWNISEGILPHPGKAFWIGLVVLGLVVVALKVGYEVERARSRSGWSTVMEEVSPLPSNAIHALKMDRENRVVIATDRGVSFWQPSTQAPWGERPLLLDQENSGLRDDRVLTLLQDHQGIWWFGTASGLSRWDGMQDWQAFTGKEMGLASSQIQALLEDQSGQIWVGTNAGAAVYDGKAWKAFTHQNSGLADDAVFAMAEQVSDGRSKLWFGTLKGASQFDPSTSTWQSFDLSAYSLGWSGVSDILVDRQGKVWVATLGDGISVWDGKTWATYRNSNSNIPLNSVTRVIETKTGDLWLGFSYSTEPGGLVARFTNNTWQTFSPSNSGYNGDETSALLVDPNHRLWIGTAVHGLQIFQMDR